MSRSCTDVRPEIHDFTPYSPGLSIDEIRERYGLFQVIKLASNENPLGASPQVQKALQKSASLAFRYPQSGNPRLIQALAAHYRLPEDMLVVGNGSDEIIDLFIRILAVPGKHTIITCDPCFSMYTLQARLAGVAQKKIPLNPDFSFNWEALRAAVDEHTVLIFLTTPDNPSGSCPPRDEVLAFAASLPPHVLLIMDEAYMDFADSPGIASVIPCLAGYPNLAVIRTFSKSFGLAGMRVGFGIMPPRLADSMRRVRLPFSVGVLAEEAAIAALDDTAFFEETLKTVREGREYLKAALEKLRCRVAPSSANYLMFRLPDDCGYTAQNVVDALLTRGVIIRPLKSYGLPDHLRVSIGNATENKMFVNTLGNLLARKGRES